MSDEGSSPGRPRGPHDVSPRTIAIIFGVMLAGLGIGMLLVMPHYGPRKPRHRSALGHAVPMSMIGRETNGMVYIPGGLFVMGSNEGNADETPVHDVTVAPVWMDKTEVTNEQFSKFVEMTGYITAAERRKSDADWRHPAGPNTSIAGKELYPAVQVAWEDATAFAKWAGKRLPTEAEWEHAARGGLHQKRYVWGSEKLTEKEPRCNVSSNTPTKVASFAPNDFSLMDMAGNVAEWCSDWYDRDYYKKSPKLNPNGPDQPTSERVIRGGSFRSEPGGPEDFRPGARSKATPETARLDLGFRCVKDAF